MNLRYRILIGISALLYYSGLMQVMHWLHRRTGKRLLILNYHHASGGELRQHLLYLRKHFRIHFLDNALETLFDRDNKNTTPRRDRRLPLALTFDDGYVDNYIHAYPLVCELQIPITIFLTSGLVGMRNEMLTWEQVEEMQASSWVKFGGHTLYHTVLSSLENIEETLQEVGNCRSLLEEKLEQPIRIFAYPHGGIEHIGVNGLLAVQRSGYQWAVTTIPGSNSPHSYPYLLHRFSAVTQMHWLLIALITSGLWDVLSALHWFNRRVRNPTRLQLKRLSNLISKI
jgi:peptidoglycan/xylan/chitin deacetylase (PgdA/CDA1 family)